MKTYRRLLLITDYCLTPFECITNSAILINGGVIEAIGGATAFTKDPDLKILELKNCYAMPGFIDTHIHGAGGFDSSTACDNFSSFEKMSKVLASHGVTAFVPSIISAPIIQMQQALTTIAKFIETPQYGAIPVGIHLEGPFIAPARHGSQRIEDIREIDLGLAKELIQAGNGQIKTMTFAPELPHAIELIELLRENDIIPSMGHSNAVEKQVLNAIDAGATRCTHLYNGMPPLHQRDISLAAVALTDNRVSIELILDGAHLHSRMIDIACRSKPKNLIVGVSDAIQAAGLNDGVYHLGLSKINVIDGKAVTSDGTLAGTTLTLEKGWHHLLSCSHMKQTDVASCFTINPAESIGLTDRGALSPGNRSDIAIFDSQTNKTKMTIVQGNIVYTADPSISL